MKHTSWLQKILSGIFIFFFLSTLVGLWRDARRKDRGALAIVHVSGPIRLGFVMSGWADRDASDIARELHRLSQDEDVKAIVMRINSPGGTVGAVQEIYEEMARCRSKGKVIVASLGDVAASGGYYLASGADRIVSNPGTITGSIGVLLQFGNLEGLFQKVGLKLQVIKSGEYKDIGSPARPLTPEERRLLQASIDDAYQQFFDAVREGRRMTPEKLRNVADGRIVTGRQALSLGLVDELGNQHVAVQTAIRLAKLPEKPFIISDRKRSIPGLLQLVSSRLAAQPVEALREVVSASGLEYRWHP